jgi:hypothetical protein
MYYGYIEASFLNSDLKSRLDQLVHLQKKEKIKILNVKEVIKNNKKQTENFFQIRPLAFLSFRRQDLTLN